MQLSLTRCTLLARAIYYASAMVSVCTQLLLLSQAVPLDLNGLAVMEGGAPRGIIFHPAGGRKKMNQVNLLSGSDLQFLTEQTPNNLDAGVARDNDFVGDLPSLVISERPPCPFGDADEQSGAELRLEEAGNFGIEAPADESERVVFFKEDNEKLRKMIAHLQRYNKSLQALVEFEYPSPNQKRTLLAKLEQEFGISRRHACRILKLARSTFWYKSSSCSQEKMIAG